MSATIPNGALPKTGKFAVPAGVRLDQAFLDAAHASRYSADPIFRKHYYCNLIGQSSFGTWLTENMGYAESCYTEYSLLRHYPVDRIVKLSNVAPIVVAVSPATAVLPIAAGSHYVSGNYVLPQIGDGILLPPNGTIAIVTAVTVGVSTTTITVRLHSAASAAVTIPIGAEVIVMTGKELADCDCPTGQLVLEDAPVEQPLTMFEFGNSSNEICGEALLKCQNVKYAYTYTDEQGNLVETDRWYGGALQTMYQDHEAAKFHWILFNQTFGIIPTLKAKSIRWNWADPDALTTDDIADLKQAILQSGINCFEYSFALGSKAFASAQELASTLGLGRITYGCFNPEDCKWINLNHCAISIAGMTIHFYEENSFSNGKMLGASGFNFGNKGIGLPLCDKPANLDRSGADDNKMFTIVHFRDVLGRIHDNLTDSDGILNGPNGRNTFGAGCDKHVFTIKSKFTVEVSCPEAWVLVNFEA